MTVPNSKVGRTLSISTSYYDNSGPSAPALPQRIAVFAQGGTTGSFALTKKQVFSSAEVGTDYVFGSPLHLISERLFPASGDGVGSIPVTVYPIAEGTTASVGDITPVADQTFERSYVLSVNGIESESFVIAVGESVAVTVAKIVAAVNAVPRFPMIATDGTTKATLTAKWKGTTGDELVLAIANSGSGASTFTLTQPTGGAGVPDIAAALAQLGDTWETYIINALGEESTVLTALSDSNEARWGGTIRRPFRAAYGSNVASVATAIAVTDTRKTDRTNFQTPAPGSITLPFVIAASWVQRMAVRDESRDGWGYTRLVLSGVAIPTNEADSWDDAERETAVTSGCSTALLTNSQYVIYNAVTMYSPVGDPDPAYRFVSDLTKIFEVLYGLEAIFNGDDWANAPLLANDDPTTNTSAKKPKNAISSVNSLQDGLALRGLITNASDTKKLTTAVITGPKTLAVGCFVQLSGTTNILDVNNNFGFNFGGS